MSLPIGGSQPALAPPRTAAVAGIVFSVLLIASLVLIRMAIPADPSDPVPWADPSSRNTVSFALNLVPFAGIVFLWSMGVLRSRLGAQEDQFFATVFLGSGLLFVAILFVLTAMAVGLLAALSAGTIQMSESDNVVVFVRETTFVMMNVFGIKMAGVFMFSTCTIALRTGFLARWVVLVGYGFAVVLLLVITRWPWIALLFPLWILLASGYILRENFRGEHAGAAGGGMAKPRTTLSRPR